LLTTLLIGSKMNSIRNKSVKKKIPSVALHMLSSFLLMSSTVCLLLSVVGSTRSSSTPEYYAADLVDPANQLLWLAHKSVGEASFDAFAQHPNNPIYVGSNPTLWPVNGFLYQPPPPDSTNITVYAGLYGAGYRKPWDMLPLSSTDTGRTFSVGTNFTCDNNTTLFNLSHGCPDGAVSN
jgi:hypothetical protein